MAQKEVHINEIAVKGGTEICTRKCSTGITITNDSSFSSIRSEKPLPHYLRDSTGSCHDICKYGRKHDSVTKSKRPQKPLSRYQRASTGSCHDMCKYGQKHESEIASKQRPFLSKSGGKLRLRDESLLASNLHVEDGKNKVTIKKKCSSQKDELSKKSADSNLKSGLKLKDDGTSEEYIDIKLETVSLCPKSSVTSDQEVLRTSECKEAESKLKEDGTPEDYIDMMFQSVLSFQGSSVFADQKILRTSETQVEKINLKDETKRQVIKLKTHKSDSFCYKSKFGKQKNSPPAKGIGSFQRSGAITNKNPTFLEPTASSKAKLVRQRSLTMHDNHSDLNHNSSVSQVNEEYATSKKIGITKEKEKTGHTSREITKTSENKILRPSTASPSVKRVSGGILSLRQRTDKIVKEATLIKNQVSKADHDTEFSVEKTLLVVDNSFEKVSLDSSEQKVLEAENVLSELQKQTLMKHESSEEKTFQVVDEIPKKANLDSSEEKLIEENVDTHFLVEELLGLENINLNTDLESPEANHVNANLAEQEVPDPENIKSGKVALNSDDSRLIELENNGIKFPEQNFLKPEEIDSESIEMEPTQLKLLKAENGLTVQKILKPDDMVLISLALKHHDNKLYEQVNTDNSTEQNLVGQDTMDINSPVLKSDDDQLATDDEEKDEVSEYSYSEQSEVEPEHEVEKDKGNCEPSKRKERRSKRNTVIHPEDTNPTAHKLKFRRGKTIELQPESCGPRRLRFRRRTADVGAEDIQTERKNFKKSEITEPANASGAEAKGIMLKHQDMQEKNDERVLFNNVIEETASKLVETRKSKVKALVGAFETVISLQDKKLESTT
ncbi:uncharacterized protein LOC122002334 [Zingiber officinale]|uniref:Calmodulin-binding domain-containing protein n=1 Tax=Zingiber officinale TaxID=94328 RepID=A0A8J5FX20_ZINOF|nr:uncharacterized protein LOC122002334 [Zingiber officinale]KAG6493732.1 hypothetical protein ZIOFF_048733 [Zingiber officinale]